VTSRRAIVVVLAMLVAFLAIIEVGTRTAVQKASRLERRIAGEYANALQIRRSPADRKVLVIGNSLLLADVQFDSLRARLAPEWTATRFVVEQTFYLDWYYALRHMMATGVDPDAVVLVLSADQLVLSEIRGDYSIYRLMGPREALDVSHDLQLHPTATASYLLSSLSAFYGLRAEYRKVLLGRLMPDMQTLTPHIVRFSRPALPDSEIYRRAHERLTRLKTLLDSRHTRVVFVLAPLLGPQHWNDVVVRAATDVGMPVLKPFDEHSFTDADYTADRFHMNETGARHFTARLLPPLRDVLSPAATSADSGDNSGAGVGRGALSKIGQR
jgi:hypothetical protein